jgi:5-methylcytosine-specific restriction endonuclease McrA
VAIKNTIGAGNLFPRTAKSIFLRVTGERYDNMLGRVIRKGFYGLPFDKEQFRAHVLAALGGNYDGFVRCRYCTGFFPLGEVAVDHALPLARGGGVDLDNLEYPCKGCNDAKGGMTPTDYLKLLGFLDNHIPLAKADVLHRLKIAVKLAAGERGRRNKQK